MTCLEALDYAEANFGIGLRPMHCWNDVLVKRSATGAWERWRRAIPLSDKSWHYHSSTVALTPRMIRDEWEIVGRIAPCS